MYAALVGARVKRKDLRTNRGRQVRERGEVPAGHELEEPGGLDAYAMPDQRRFAEERREVGALVGVATVERRQRVESGVGHAAGARVVGCLCYP